MYDYTPFGQVTASGTAEQPIQWSSEYNDTELGLVYYNYRHYTPKDGRWINRDPIAELGGWCLYVFVGNNGVNDVDYLGLYYDKNGDNFIGPAEPGECCCKVDPLKCSITVEWIKNGKIIAGGTKNPQEIALQSQVYARVSLMHSEGKEIKGCILHQDAVTTIDALGVRNHIISNCSKSASGENCRMVLRRRVFGAGSRNKDSMGVWNKFKFFFERRKTLRRCVLYKNFTRWRVLTMIGSTIIFYFFCLTLFEGCQNHSGKQGICNMGNNIEKEKIYADGSLYFEIGSRNKDIKFDWITKNFNGLNNNVKKGRISSTNITEGEEDPFTHIYDANGNRLSTASGQK